MKFLIKLVVYALAVFIAAHLLPGVHIDNVLSALLVAAVLSFLNAVVKPLMILFTLPITLFSFGLFLVVINALIILIADRLIDSFVVDGFWYALLFSIVLSLVNSLLEFLNRRTETSEEE